MQFSGSRPAAWLRVTSLSLLLCLPAVAAAEPLRAAAVTAGPPERELGARIALARAALVALDAVQTLSPVRAAALREALVPAASDGGDATAEAFALAASAPALGATNAGAAAALYERALGLVFEKLPAEAARRFLDAHGASAEKALAASQRLTPELARRLRLWREAAPAAATAQAMLTVEPADARVYLDGRAVPDAARNGAVVTLGHEPGAHDVRVEKDGYVGQWQAATLALGAAATLAARLRAQGGADDLARQRAALDPVHRAPEALAPLLRDLAKRLDVALVFVTTPDDGGALVRLFDAEAGAFAGASPVASSDAPTLTRAFRALLELRTTGTRLVESPDRPRKKRGGGLGGLTGSDALWKKWWFWTLVAVGAGAVTGAVILSRDTSSDGTLTIRLRRGQ